jgi:AraC-like DNA-binding protein
METYNLFLNNLPFVGVLMGVFIMVLLFTSKESISNKKARRSLLFFVILNTHFQLDSFLVYNGWEDGLLLEFSYLHYHLSGLLIYLFTIHIFNLKYNKRLWISLVVAYTILRLSVIFAWELLLEEDHIDEATYQLIDLTFMIDYYLAILVNLFFLILAFVQLQRTRFAIQLSGVEMMNFRWVKALLITSIVVYTAIFQSALISFFVDDEFMLFMKIESLIASFIFFAFAYFAVRFPIFSIKGDFGAMSESQAKKYANSSLNDNRANALWEKVNQLFEEDRVYRNPEYRLNNLAEDCDSSVHHLSQLINEQKKLSYTDFVNQYRIQDALELLKDKKGEQLTILGIAYEVGFNSKSAFYNAFKKQTGQTPSEFKKNFLILR